MEEHGKTHLKYFGIGRILPYLQDVKKLLILMILCGLYGSNSVLPGEAFWLDAHTVYTRQWRTRIDIHECRSLGFFQIPVHFLHFASVQQFSQWCHRYQ